MSFQKDFVWGAATAAYQIEGAAHEDGKGANIWDDFCKIPGKIEDCHNGDIACDHYHRYKEDVALMHELGIQAYRFSVSWSRILPNGTGEINAAGIRFYNQLIDELIQNGIEPYITLYHWDLPTALYRKGGWLNEECVSWFGNYAKVIAEHFSDRVKYFFTFNEPQCFIGNGYIHGDHAPGLKLSPGDTLQIAHNVLKSHGQAVKALREYAKQAVSIGYAPTGPVCYPASNSLPDIDAARKTMFGCPQSPYAWSWNISWLVDPVILGSYPEDGLAYYSGFLPKITDRDMELIHQPIDFLGQNIYNGIRIGADTQGNGCYQERYAGFPRTAIDWPVTPECLYWGPRFLYERYHKPIYITENGMSCHDWVSLDGKVHDPNRQDFLHRYLKQLKKACEDGIDVSGYFVWSLLDNFEWAKGYNQRFGIVYTDYQTQQRIIKDSGYWYRDVIQTNGNLL